MTGLNLEHLRTQQEGVSGSVRDEGIQEGSLQTKSNAWSECTSDRQGREAQVGRREAISVRSTYIKDGGRRVHMFSVTVSNSKVH